LEHRFYSVKLFPLAVDKDIGLVSEMGVGEYARSTSRRQNAVKLKGDIEIEGSANSNLCHEAHDFISLV
jgi:hypothetical protein